MTLSVFLDSRPMNRAEFIASIKSKYPQYASLPDAELYSRVITKYPQYKESIAIGDEGVMPEQAASTPAKEPRTSEDFLKLAESLPKGSKEREDAINMGVRLKEPGAAGNALALTSMIPIVEVGLPRALLGLVGAGLGGHVGKFLGSGIPIKGAADVGEVVGSVGGGLAGGIGGVGAVRSLAEAVPGYSGHLARAALKAIGAGTKAAATEAVAAPAAVSAEEALIAQAAKQYPGLSADQIRQALARNAVTRVPAAAAPAAAPAVSAVPASVASSAVAPAAAAPAAAAMTKEEASLKLQQLLAQKVREGQVEAAKEAAKGSRQLAEQILSRMQGEGVTTP
jgi:hypothetical protein